MKNEKLPIMLLEPGDTVWLDKKHGWCDILEIVFGLTRITISFEVAISYSGEYPMGIKVGRTFNNNKEFFIYE